MARRRRVVRYSLPEPTRRATIAERSARVELAADHASAAVAAFSRQRPVLLTTGSRNRRYVAEARRSGSVLVVRVLEHADSIEACHLAGVGDGK